MATNDFKRYVLLVAFFAVRATAIHDYCMPSFCDVLPKNQSSRVHEYCVDHGWGDLDDRCCRDGLSIVGLDLRDCHLNATSFLKNAIYHNVSIIDLTMNPTLELDEDDFDGYSMLDRLYLDRATNASCPGGSNSWNTSDGGDNDILACLTQLNTCDVTSFQCPHSIGENTSHCESHGPGLKNLYCVCNEGFHGYKCMRKGTFPQVAFGAGLSGATVGVAGFLWLTNRRLVKS